MNAALVFLGATFGAPLRYLLDRYLQRRHPGEFPWGTFVVNATGCLVLGALAGSAAQFPGWIFTLGGAGFCGAFTTFSTFGYETVRLMERDLLGLALVNIAGSVTVGLAGCITGFWLARLAVG